MMRRGSHAAGDSSFGRSAGLAVGRAAALLIVNVVLIVVLLNASDSGRRVTAGARSTTTTAKPSTTTTTSRATTTTTPLRAPRDIKVIAANATTVQGAAAKVSEKLRAAGYNVLAPLTAKRADASAVYFTGDLRREAEEVAKLLELDPSVVAELPEAPAPTPVTDVRGADVLVLIGPDLAGRATTSTTRRATTTTRRSTTTTTRATTSTSGATTTTPG